jgi:hypothetical protein
MKNPIKIVKIIVILAVIVVLSLGVIAIINQFSLSNYEISKSPLFESPQIQKEPAKVEPKVESVQTDLSIKTNSQSVFLEGFQDSYKINDSIKFTLVFKEGQKCGTIELSLIDTKTSEFVNGIGFDDMCNSPYLSEDLRISIPYQEENSPFKTDKVGSYKIVITNGGETVLEKEFVVKSIDQS